MPDIKYIKSITIEKRDGQRINISAGRVMLTGGVFLSADANPDDISVTLNAGPDRGIVDWGMIAKYDAMIKGGHGSYKGVPYTFSGAPYYYSEIAGAVPIKGHAFLTAKLSSHIGLFEDNIHPTEIDPADPHSDKGKGVLEITDVNRPCVDCAEYEHLYQYVDAVRDAITSKKDILYKDQEQQPTDTQQLNMLRLDKQLFLYWNNMVQKTSWRCNAIADGAEINAACMFTNHFDTPLAGGTYFRVTLVGMSFYVGDQSANLPPPVSEFIDHSVPSGWIKGIDYDLSKYPEGRTFRYKANWSADFIAHTVTVTTDSAQGIPDPDIAVGTRLYVSGVEPDGSFTGGSYIVTSGDFHSFTISVPDINTSGASSGTLEWVQLIVLELKLHTPLPIEESIRFYIGAYSAAYSGTEGKVDVVFENNIKNTSGIEDYPDTKQVTTNNMVVIENRIIPGDN